jgi:hypothetical protein
MNVLDVIGPAEYIAWDEEDTYFQVYGDNGTICETNTAEKAAIIAASLRAAARDGGDIVIR